MSKWYFNLQVDFESHSEINGIRFYACKNGVLKIHPDNTKQFIHNNFFE